MKPISSPPAAAPTILLLGLLPLVLAGAGSANPFVVHEDCLDAEHVVVEESATPLPTDPAELRSMLWQGFVDREICDRFQCPVREAAWQWDRFAGSLARKAAAAGLDGDSLARCLDALHEDAGGRIELPIQASLARQEGRPVWVILVKWESGPHPDDAGDARPDVLLGHVSVHALDAADGRPLAIASCR